MAKITRRSAATMIAALPLVAACEPQATDAPTTPAIPPDAAAAAPVEPAVTLTQAELDMIDAMTSEFELAENWQGHDATVAPSEASDAVLRKGMSATVKDTYARLRAGADYFHWSERDEETVDYHHFAAMGPTLAGQSGAVSTGFDETAFDLTHDTLVRIAEANSFAIPTGAGARKLVFGLRGCVIDGAGGRTLGPSVRLREARPDHSKYRCVIGVWDPAARQVAAFKSSTVPLEVHLAVYQRWLAERAKDPKNPPWRLTACMIPQGLHTRRVDVMYMGSSTVCPVTLKQHSATPVLREMDWTKSSYTLASTWDPPEQIDGYNRCHIHASINAKWGNPDYQFSSQGCQTIDGWYENGQAKGEIAAFNAAMAFENANGLMKSKSNQQIYQFMLVTGREARLHAAGADAMAMRRVRIGSSATSADHVVVKLNQAIGAGSGKMKFDDASMLKLVKAQSDGENYDGVKPDGIYTPTAASTGQFGEATFST